MTNKQLTTILIAIVLGISSWSLLKLVDQGELLAIMQVHMSDVSSRLGDLEK